MGAFKEQLAAARAAQRAALADPPPSDNELAAGLDAVRRYQQEEGACGKLGNWQGVRPACARTAFPLRLTPAAQALDAQRARCVAEAAMAAQEQRLKLHADAALLPLAVLEHEVAKANAAARAEGDLRHYEEARAPAARSLRFLLSC